MIQKPNTNILSLCCKNRRWQNLPLQPGKSEKALTGGAKYAKCNPETAAYYSKKNCTSTGYEKPIAVEVFLFAPCLFSFSDNPLFQIISANT
jgi:hypothetical protein